MTLSGDSPEIIFAGTKDGLYVTGDGGNESSIRSAGLTSYDITSIEISSPHSNVAFAATWGDGLFVSTDGGNNWRQLNRSIRDPRIDQIVSSPSNPEMIYLATANGVMFSFDHGATWRKNKGLLDYTLVETIAVHPHEPATVYAGTVPSEIRTFEFADSRTVYLATWGAGVYRYRFL